MKTARHLQEQLVIIIGKSYVLFQALHSKSEEAFEAAYGEFGKNLFNSLNDFIINVQAYKKIRMLGSAALMLAYVACGYFDVYHEDDIFIWDVAAGAIIVKEAGAATLVESIEQSRWPLFGPQKIWQPLRTFPQCWQSGTTTIKNLRDWSTPIVVGNALVAQKMAESIVIR